MFPTQCSNTRGSCYKVRVKDGCLIGGARVRLGDMVVVVVFGALWFRGRCSES